MQRILATWAVKTAMTSEHFNKKPAVQQHERDWLMQNLSPPPGWFVSAISYVEQNGANSEYSSITDSYKSFLVENGTTTEHNLGLTFIGAGHLFLLVRHSTWPKIWPILGFDIEHVPTIWPTSEDINWPPPYVFSDVETEYLTTYLARVLNHRV